MKILGWEIGMQLVPRGLSAALAMWACGIANPVSAQQVAPEILTEAVMPKDVQLPTDNGSSVVRKRFVGVNAKALDAVKAAGGGKAVLTLFEDVAVEVEFDRVESRSESRYAMGGHVGDKANSFVALARYGEAVVANITTAGGDVFMIRYRGKGVHEVVHTVGGKEDFRPAGDGAASREIDAGIPSGDSSGPVAKDPFPAESGSKATIAKDDGSMIDLLAAYTELAAEQNGGVDGIVAVIDLGVEETNFAFEQSLIFPRINLVHTTMTSYSESGNILIDVALLQGDEDGVIDEIHVERDDYMADLVTMYVGSAEGGCGTAYLYPDGGAEQLGFSVIVSPCAETLTLAHQLGKNLGAGNARDDEGNGNRGAFEYSFGHRWFGNQGVTWSTVMNEPPGNRLPHFSNPLVVSDGQPTGVPAGQPGEADNALTINQTSRIVADYREGGSTGTPKIADGFFGSLQVFVNAGQIPVTQNLRVANQGTGYLNYSVKSTTDPNDPLLVISPAKDEITQLELGTHKVAFTNKITTFPPGNYSTKIIIEADKVVNSPYEIQVLIRVLRPCSYSITPTKGVHGYTQASSAVAVTGSNEEGACPWNAFSDDSWITVQTPSGSGGGSVAYSLAPNPTSAFRSGKIIIAQRTYTVYQHGAPSEPGGVGTQSGIAAEQRFAILTGGGWYQELFYNYSTGEPAVTLPRNVPTSPAYILPQTEWLGIFHFDYAEGRFTQAVYKQKVPLP